MATVNVSIFLRLKDAIENSTTIEIIITDDTTTFLSQTPLQFILEIRREHKKSQKVTKITWDKMKCLLLYVEADKNYPAGKIYQQTILASYHLTD